MPNNDNYHSRPRSCEECNRKKSKCDNTLPVCQRCTQTGAKCVYPTSRKRVSLKTKYESLRRKLAASKNTDEIDGLLDHVDPAILQAALQRRGITADQARDAQSDQDDMLLSITETHATLPVSEVPVMSLPSQHIPVLPTLSTPEHNGANNQDWLDSMVFGSCTDQPGMPNFFDTTQMNAANATSVQSVSEDLSFPDGNTCTLTFPSWLVDDLIDLYFHRVQPSIPLLHKPRFHRKYKVGVFNNERYARLPLEDALVLTAVMALSARYSNSHYFVATLAKDRGKVFAQKATALYAEIIRSDVIDESSLTFLHGCILLAYYMQTYEITTRGWLLIGTCCRLGVELGLDQTDAEAPISTSTSTPQDEDAAIEWSLKEEKRRAWWLVWELDVFTATILRRPSGISKSQMNVLLPVSDSFWFADTPTRSVFLQSDLLHIWQTLENFPAADERAWFLVTSSLMAVAANLSTSSASSQDVLNFESTLNCFALLLPEVFHLDFLRTPFNENNFAANNWVFLTVFMLHGVRVLTRNAQHIKSRGDAGSLAGSGLPLATGPYSDTYLIFGAMQNWPPQYLIYACPFVVCTLIGPSFDNVRAALLFEPGNHGNYLSLLKLIIKRIGKFWEIGQAALKLIDIFENEIKVKGSSRKHAFRGYAKDFSLLVEDSTPDST